MDIKVISATGMQTGMKVDVNNRAWTDSVSKTQKQEASLSGDGYNISTGTITLTSANQSAVCYIESNESLPLVLDRVLVVLGESTGGAGAGTIEILKNPKDGTLVDNALPVAIESNNDFGSTNELDADIYKGAEGYTFTGGTTRATTTRTNFSLPVIFENQIVLRKGSSFGLLYTPPTGNTSQNIIIILDCFVEKTGI